MPWARDRTRAPTALVTREWLVTNGLGGYASGTVAGVATRRYHGLLIAALPAPLGRMMMLNHLSEQLRLPDGTTRPRSAATSAARRARPGRAAPTTSPSSASSGLPVWRYEVDGVVDRKAHAAAARAEHGARHLSAARGRRRPCGSKLLPSVHFRPHDAAVSAPLRAGYTLTRRATTATRFAGDGRMPPLRLALHAPTGGLHASTATPSRTCCYRIEEQPRLRRRGVAVEPRLLPRRSAPGQRRHARRLDRSLGDDLRA